MGPAELVEWAEGATREQLDRWLEVDDAQRASRRAEEDGTPKRERKAAKKRGPVERGPERRSAVERLLSSCREAYCKGDGWNDAGGELHPCPGCGSDVRWLEDGRRVVREGKGAYGVSSTPLPRTPQPVHPRVVIPGVEVQFHGCGDARCGEVVVRKDGRFATNLGCVRKGHPPYGGYASHVELLEEAARRLGVGAAPKVVRTASLPPSGASELKARWVEERDRQLERVVDGGGRHVGYLDVTPTVQETVSDLLEKSRKRLEEHPPSSAGSCVCMECVDKRYPRRADVAAARARA